jgi:hypothetical protein
MRAPVSGLGAWGQRSGGSGDGRIFKREFRVVSDQSSEEDALCRDSPDPAKWLCISIEPTLAIRGFDEAPADAIHEQRAMPLFFFESAHAHMTGGPNAAKKALDGNPKEPYITFPLQTPTPTRRPNLRSIASTASRISF